VPDAEAGFEIKHPEAEQGKFYPWPASFRLGDTVLVEKVTGLDWPDFAARLPNEGEEVPDIEAAADDIVIYIGLIAVSIWQHHPQWRRDKVAKYVEQLNLDRVVFIGGDEPDEDADERPPAPTADGGNNSGTSPPPSNPEAGSESDEPNPTSSGGSTSPTDST
jgi:hypothetical protein